MLWGANPVYDHPDGAAFRAALAKVALTISFADRRDETSAHVHAVCPDHHFLEAWGDAEPVSGHFSLRQPLIAPLHDTRAAEESLLTWAGRPTDHRTHLRAFWERELFPRAARRRAGSRTSGSGRSSAASSIFLARRWRRVRSRATGGAVRDIVSRAKPAGGDDAGYELALQETVGARDGRHANNPWLLELPDPMTRLTWGNVARSRPRRRPRWASRPATSSR